MKFKKWLESRNPEELFGVESRKKKEPEDERDQSDLPIMQFNFELLSDLLEMKNVGLYDGRKNYHSEVQWGHQPGALKVLAQPDMRTTIKRLGLDLNGNHRWLTKRIFQIKKNGYGGFEDVVANELYDVLKEIHNQELEAPNGNFDEMEPLVRFVTNKVRRVMPNMLIFKELRRLTEDHYVSNFELTGNGAEAPNQQQIEQLELEYAYDRENGLIRIISRFVESKVGRTREWKLAPSYLDIIFFPSQSFDEIAEPVAVHMKYAYQWPT